MEMQSIGPPLVGANAYLARPQTAQGRLEKGLVTLAV